MKLISNYKPLTWIEAAQALTDGKHVQHEGNLGWHNKQSLHVYADQNYRLVEETKSIEVGDPVFCFSHNTWGTTVRYYRACVDGRFVCRNKSGVYSFWDDIMIAEDGQPNPAGFIWDGSKWVHKEDYNNGLD